MTMKNKPKNPEEVLAHQISGFHQYSLRDAIHLHYVSQNLCAMLGVEEGELLHPERDLLAAFVHPADREIYADFLQNLAEREQTLCAEYRLMKRNGAVIRVRNHATSVKSEDGALIASCTLTELAQSGETDPVLQFLNETKSIPCGFLRYTCEKQPRITYIDPKMAELLRFPQKRDGETEDRELYLSNIFLLIPVEERLRFARCLSRADAAEAPIAGEMTLLRCDGTRAYVFGWMTKVVNARGEEEFQSVCMDMTKRHNAQKARETKQYLKALADVYDEIFELDLRANTFKCLHCGENSAFRCFENIAMQLEDALERWLLSAVEEGQRQRVRGFFRQFCRREWRANGAKPPQIIYSAHAADGRIERCSGIFIQIDDAVSLYCCRRMQDAGAAALLQSENAQLKENMKELVMHFSDGIAAFELSPEGLVKPLYASENVCEFFGYTAEEWLPLTEKFTPWEAFVAYSEASYEDFVALLKNGEAEFTYFDYKTETEHTIKAICSRKEPNDHSSRYVMLYAAEKTADAKPQSLPDSRDVFIRTFGYFDVFVGERPIAFRNKKSKELLALLVDRKGGYVTSEEAIGFLWEDETVNSLTLARYRKAALRLKNTLEEYGISEIVETVDGKRRIAAERVCCDLYQYLSGQEEYAQLFKGSYLTNYSWAEMTLGELISDEGKK